MFVTSWIAGLLGADKVMALRREVFVEEQGVSEAEEFDWFDGIAMHLLVEEQESGEAIACGRIYPDAGVTKLGRIAVRKPYRNLPYDELVLRVMLDKAQRLAGETIVAEVERGQRTLFEMFGFKAPENQGDAAGNGRLRMSAARDGIIWDSACKRIPNDSSI